MTLNLLCSEPELAEIKRLMAEIEERRLAYAFAVVREATYRTVREQTAAIRRHFTHLYRFGAPERDGTPPMAKDGAPKGSSFIASNVAEARPLTEDMLRSAWEKIRRNDGIKPPGC